MSAGLILAIDQGTTNTKALLIDQTGQPVFRAAAPVALVVSAEGLVEQYPLELWESVLAVIETAVVHAREAGDKIEALALSNQRETALAWSAETGLPLAPAISWQCTRAAAICTRLAPHAGVFRAKTGLPLAPLVSAGKWAWLLENNTSVRNAARRGDLHLGTVDAWLIHRLTGGAAHATDLTNASRTGLLNIETLQWDRSLLALFGIPESAMPALHSSSALFGECRTVDGLAGVPILAAIGDSHAALFGHGRYAPGTIKATYGTGSSLMALTPALVPDTTSLARTVAWSIAGKTQFALEGNIAMTGSAVQWMGEFLGLANPAADLARLAVTVPNANGVYFVPAMVGLGAPHWDAAARGALTGLGRNHTSAHAARAAIDAIAYQIADVFYAMERASELKFPELRVDGGATRNTQLMQFQADILDCPVLRSKDEELSAIGAAWLAGLELGWWRSTAELEALPQQADRFTPAMSAENRTRLYTGWTRAIARVRADGEAV